MSCFLVISESYYTLNTPAGKSGYQQGWLVTPEASSLRFTVTACSDAWIAMSQTPASYGIYSLFSVIW